MFDSSPKFLYNVHKNISQSGKLLYKMTKVFPKIDAESVENFVEKFLCKLHNNVKNYLCKMTIKIFIFSNLNKKDP